MKVGYIRVSTVEQNPARQEEIMKEYGVEKIFEEKVSGKNTKDRPEFNRMLEYVREGDMLYIESFSRLSRSTQDLLKTVNILKEKGVVLISNKEKLDTNTPQGKFMLTVFAALSEFERENILERQREGIAIAKAQGKYKGRPEEEVPEQFIVIAKDWAAGKLKLKDAVRKSGVSSPTFFRRCKKCGIRKEVQAA